MKTISALLAVTVMGVSAQAREVKVFSPAEGQPVVSEDVLNQALGDETSFYSWNAEPTSFESWKADKPLEYKYLVPADGYVDPMQLVTNPDVERLTMFVAKGKVVLGVPGENLRIEKVVDLEFINSIKSEIKNQQISSAQTMPEVAGKYTDPNDESTRVPIENFKWCGEKSFRRPHRGPDLISLRANEKPWCSDQGTLCVESCYTYPGNWGKFIGIHNLGVGKARSIDRGTATQSEIRFYKNEQEFGKPVSELTGVQGEVVGIYQQNFFYYNQIFQYGKVLVIFQKQGDKTVASSFVAIGIHTRTYNKFGSDEKPSFMPDVFMGRMPAVEILGYNAIQVNTETGITAGLPRYSAEMVEALTSRLEEISAPTGR
ncbi:MAG TPA: hypothetical protein PKC28_16125 [Bdellovibrionales bacterium]|nr:hypothetical protein [Bdellovibrionales bacterium]